MPDSEPLVFCLFLGNVEAGEDDEIPEFLYEYASHLSEKFLLFSDHLSMLEEPGREIRLCPSKPVQRH